MLASFKKVFPTKYFNSKSRCDVLKKSVFGYENMQVSPYQCRTWVVMGMAWLRDPFFSEVIRRKGCH